MTHEVMDHHPSQKTSRVQERSGQECKSTHFSLPTQTNAQAPDSATTVWDTLVTAERARHPQGIGFWHSLPYNRKILLLCALLLFSAGFCQACGVQESMIQAIKPYSNSGQQEICMTHLQRLRQAMALYQQQYDDYYPPLESP